MFLHCPTKSLAAAALVLTLSALMAGCEQEQTGPLPSADGISTPTTPFMPGGGALPPRPASVQTYSGDPVHINNGKRYFGWYNCTGCHFHGAGGIGPALMDDQWMYGGRIDQIFASIYQGRPNGMPAWGRKIPDKELWEIAAYVESLPTSRAAQGPAPKGPPPPVERRTRLDAAPPIVREDEP